MYCEIFGDEYRYELTPGTLGERPGDVSSDGSQPLPALRINGTIVRIPAECGELKDGQAGMWNETKGGCQPMSDEVKNQYLNNTELNLPGMGT